MKHKNDRLFYFYVVDINNPMVVFVKIVSWIISSFLNLNVPSCFEDLSRIIKKLISPYNRAQIQEEEKSRIKSPQNAVPTKSRM